MAKVAYITSGKLGIHRFTYNELIELKNNEIDFILCLTQLNMGSWMPPKNWKIVVASKWKAISQLIQFFAIHPFKIFKLMKEALKYNIIPYFMISLSFYNQLNKQLPTSIHCQMGDKKLYIGYFLKQLLNTPLTVTIHAHELYQREVYDNNSELRRLFSYCDKVITISDFNVSIIKNVFGVSEDKLSVMRLFPDIDYKNKVNNKKRILVVANWIKKKGYKTLFESVKMLDRNDFVVWVVGEPILSDDSIDLNKLVDNLDISEKIELLGPQGGVLLDIIFSASDIFCLPSITDYYEDGNPSEREGIPVALMEAMAWGKPVIATNHAGNSELISELLVEENNIIQLKDTIEYLLDNPRKWKEMGLKNKQVINEKYTKQNVKTLVNILNSFN